MNQFAEPLILGGRSKKKLARLRPWVILSAPVAAILFQVYVPLYVPLLGYLELPLLAVVYLAFSRRGEISGLLIGAAVGLVQDCLSAHPIGIFGIVKTLAGYIAGTLAARLDTEHPVVRFSLGFSFFLFHQLLYWVLQRTLLNSAVGLGILPLFLAAVANGLLAVPLFFLLDKLRDTG
jgi:rod shape-determining protein MreD